MNVSIIKHYDCHEIVNRLSTDCHAYPADCHHWALRFRVSWFKSAHFSRSSFQIRPCRPMAPMRPMIAPWSPHDRLGKMRKIFVLVKFFRFSENPEKCAKNDEKCRFFRIFSLIKTCFRRSFSKQKIAISAIFFDNFLKDFQWISQSFS